MATLRGVPLRVRVRGALEVVASDAGLSIAARHAIVAAAIWPDAVDVPTVSQLRRLQKGWPAEVRRLAVELRAASLSEADVPRRLGIPRPTIRDWVRRAVADLLAPRSPAAVATLGGAE